MATMNLIKVVVDGKQGVLNSADIYDKALKKNLDTILSSLNTDLSEVKSSLNTFLNGTADGGDLDRLIELVNAISQNKNSIDSLVSDKINTSAIYNALDSTDNTKVLSAAQGKALKDLIDALDAKAHEHSNKAVLDAISKNATSGNLVFNGKELNGETGIAVGSSVANANNFTSKIQIILEEYDTEAGA